MNVKELLALTFADKKAWLKDQVDDYRVKAYEGELLGFVIHFNQDDLREYQEYPEDYGTGRLISAVYSEMSPERAEEIDAGAPLTDKEKEYLEEAIVQKHCDEGDVLSDVTYSIYKLECDDGEVFVAFSGISQGPAGQDFSFYNIFASREEAHKNISSNKYYFDI